MSKNLTRQEVSFWRGENEGAAPASHDVESPASLALPIEIPAQGQLCLVNLDLLCYTDAKSTMWDRQKSLTAALLKIRKSHKYCGARAPDFSNFTCHLCKAMKTRIKQAFAFDGLITRTLNAAGSNPARRTKKPPHMLCDGFF